MPMAIQKSIVVASSVSLDFDKPISSIFRGADKGSTHEGARDMHFNARGKISNKGLRGATRLTAQPGTW